jgi:hypothetical protein
MYRVNSEHNAPAPCYDLLFHVTSHAREYMFQTRLPRIATWPEKPFEQKTRPSVSAFLEA